MGTLCSGMGMLTGSFMSGMSLSSLLLVCRETPGSRGTPAVM